MKTSREQLKALMKEILVEILSEGLGNVQHAATPLPGRPVVAAQGPVTEQRQVGNRRKPAFDPRLDTPLAGGRRPTDELKDTIRIQSGGNPIMADILADTAMTTLPAQLHGGDRMSAPAPGMGGVSPGAGQEQFAGDPTEVFSGGAARADGSSHWADLAFMPTKKSA